MRLVKKLLISTFFSFILQFSAYPEPIYFEGTVTADVLNIRKDPSAESAIVASLRKGSKIMILGSNEAKSWYKITVQGKTGWVSKVFVKALMKGDSEYQNLSTIGTIRNKGIIQNGIKVTTNSKYIFVLDDAEKITLKIYDKNGNFIKSQELFYSWLINKKDKDFIALAVDEESNVFTNPNDRNFIVKYNFEGQKVSEIKDESIIDLIKISIDNENNSLYIFDNTKTVKIIDLKNNESKNVFLSESINPKDIWIKNGKIYVLDYPEKEDDYYSVYYVNSYSFSLRNNYDLKAKILENVSKGSIMKFNPNVKPLKSKSISDDSKVKEITWIDFSDDKSQKFGNSDDLKKVNITGEIDIYKTTGEYTEKFTLNNNFTLKSPERHREFGNTKIIRKIDGVSLDENNNLILPVISKNSNSGMSSMNYYYINIEKSEYKLSQPIPFQESHHFCFTSDKNTVYTLNSRGYFSVLDDTGIERDNLGISSPDKLNIPDKITYLNNRLYIFDRGNYSLGYYDLNGEPQKVKTIDQNTDLFKYENVFYTNKNIFMLKSIFSEKRKLGIEIYDLELNKVQDRWLMTIDNETEPKISVNENNEVYISAKGNYYGKDGIVFIFNDKLHLVNRWGNETDLINSYSEGDRKNFRSNSMRILGFDNQANIYLLIMDKTGAFKIHNIELTPEGKVSILKNFELDFFGDSKNIIKDGTKFETQEFTGNMNGDILNITETLNKITYVLFKERFNNISRIGIFDPTGSFWKGFSLKNFPEIKSFSLDQKENIWITDGSTIKKLGIYK